LRNCKSLYHLLLTLPGLTILFLFVLGCQSENQPAPNILLIVSDDQGYADMSCNGLSEDVSTPSLDRLAAEGTRFTQAYATSPICNPSRAGIITGCYQERWGTFWYGGKGIHNPVYKTIPELLRGKDYITGYIGKVHYGNGDGDTLNRNFPLNHGFDEFYGFTSARKHYLIHQSSAEKEFQMVKKQYERKGQSLRQEPMWENTTRVDTLAFSTGLLSNRACEFIQENRDKKFFLQVSFNAVHNFTHQLPEEYLLSKELNGYHDWDPATEDYYEWYVQSRKPNNPEGREHYLGQLYYLDREIGRILQLLDKLELRDNTIVIYISDNGGSTPIYANNFPLRGGKYTLYEGGIRVPMIISWPAKFSKGIVSENVVSGMDILPTICGSLGIETPNPIDGMDLSPILTGTNDLLAHDTLVWDTGHETAVRFGKWKLRTASSKDHADYEMTELELGEFLYNLEKDPGEKNNLAEEYPDTLDMLKEIHRTWKEKMDHQQEI